MIEPRIRVSAILQREGRVLLCRQEKAGEEYWMLPAAASISARRSWTRCGAS